MWDDQDRAREVMREIAGLKEDIGVVVGAEALFGDIQASLELALEADDEELKRETIQLLARLEGFARAGDTAGVDNLFNPF